MEKKRVFEFDADKEKERVEIVELVCVVQCDCLQRLKMYINGLVDK